VSGRAVAVGRSAGPALAAALRPHQWTKNLLVLAGLVFSGHLGDVARWPAAAAVLGAYCLLSSGAYLLNDVRDAEADRRHPTKRLRPVARGDLPPRLALAAAAVLLGAGVAVAGMLGLESLLLALVFVAGQGAYSLVLKRVVLVDALGIAVLFVVRAAAGAAAVDVRISGWLLVCTASLALFLAFGKRRAELVALPGAPAREALRRYSPQALRLLVPTAAAVALGAYVAYSLTGSDSAEMVATVPFVVFGLGRYLWLMHRRDLGEEPDRLLLADVPVLAAVALWGLSAAAALNMA
jgi:decaprenyl-phosphate phosphoribosyltransferase